MSSSTTTMWWCTGRASISVLKSRTGPAAGARPYSTVQCVRGGSPVAVPARWARIAADGRARLRRHLPPAVPQEFIGNVVLWARPAATAAELATETPLGHAKELVSRAVEHVDDAYFRSFVHFMSSGIVEEEGL
ncbi:hypothetical protein EJB05_26716, partial [Eragrostis curvula]